MKKGRKTSPPTKIQKTTNKRTNQKKKKKN